MYDGQAYLRAREGARKIFNDCLRVARGDKVSVIYDETTKETAQVILAEGAALGLQMTERYVELGHQRRFVPKGGLCRQCLAALRGHAAIITCLSDGPETTSYRRELLAEGSSGGAKIGHMPGARLFVLEWAVNVDYTHATARCEDLAFALATGETARLETATFDDHGQEAARFSLRLDLGGDSRYPAISTGVVPPSSWGNLPGGETFIAPIEGKAEGSIAINGAFKGHVLTGAEHLLLHFERGRIADIGGTPACVDAFRRLVDVATTSNDSHWNDLAELGIGVNEGITQLTGNSLFDEKCAGTIHIAIGENRNYGGTLASQIHEDLVTRQPSLWVDERPILLRGQNAFIAGDWYEDLDTYPVAPILADGDPRIGLTPEGTSAANGCLHREHKVGDGRKCIYRIGDEATSPILLSIYNNLRLRGRISLSGVRAYADGTRELTTRQLRAGLSILKRHGVIHVDGH